MQCADHRHAIILSPSSKTHTHTYLAEGVKSVVFSLVMNSDTAASFALKFDKAGTWTRTTSTKAIRSIQPNEIDATCLVWYMLSARGVSPHVPRIFGVLPFVFEKDAMPFCSESRMSKTDGLVLELLTGYVTSAGVRVVDVKGLVREGMAGRVVNEEGDDIFDEVLRVVMFQVLYTMAMWNLVTANGFRHNDCHTMNVGLTYWNEDRTPVSAEYRIPGPGGVERVFTVTSSICATIIDFGYAAVLKEAGGPIFDPRFYFYEDPCTEKMKKEPRTNTLAETKYAAWGMSHRQPSRHYDSVLFLYAVLHEFNTKKSRHPATNEYRRFYARCLGAIHSAKVYSYKDSMCGRLTPFGQRELMRNAPVMHGSKVFRVMDPSECLSDQYFARFRSGPSSARQRPMVFGLSPSPSAVAPHLSKEAMTRSSSVLSLNSADVAWKPRLTRAGILQNMPLPGLWSTLTRGLDERKAAVPLSRQMTPSECTGWTGKDDPELAHEEYEDTSHAWDEASAPSENL